MQKFELRALKALGNTVPLAQMNVLIEQAVATELGRLRDGGARTQDGCRQDEGSRCLRYDVVGVDQVRTDSVAQNDHHILTAVSVTHALKAVHDAAKSDEVELKDAEQQGPGRMVDIGRGARHFGFAQERELRTSTASPFWWILRIASQFVQDCRASAHVPAWQWNKLLA